jgi:hypothetical protein
MKWETIHPQHSETIKKLLHESGGKGKVYNYGHLCLQVENFT